MSVPSAPAVAREFVGVLVHVLRWRLLLAVGLPVFLGVTEGAGIVLLVPLLGQIGLDVGSGVPARLASAVANAFDAIGAPMTLGSVLVTVTTVSGLHAALAHWQLLLHPTLDRLMLSHYRTRLYDALVHARWSYAVQGRRCTSGCTRS
jgi:ATP-binding cassette, subfamily C, bacterial